MCGSHAMQNKLSVWAKTKSLSTPDRDLMPALGLDTVSVSTANLDKSLHLSMLLGCVLAWRYTVTELIGDTSHRHRFFGNLLCDLAASSNVRPATLEIQSNPETGRSAGLIPIWAAHKPSNIPRHRHNVPTS